MGQSLRRAGTAGKNTKTPTCSRNRRSEEDENEEGVEEEIQSNLIQFLIDFDDLTDWIGYSFQNQHEEEERVKDSKLVLVFVWFFLLIFRMVLPL